MNPALKSSNYGKTDMTKKAVIVSTDNNEITVRPIMKASCISCSHGCEKTQIEFTVSNPHNYKIEKGNIVTLDNSPFMQGISGLISLLFPFLCAILGYILAPQIAGLFNTTVSDGIRAVCVLSFLTFSCLIVFLFTRKIELPGKSTIVAVE